MKYFRHLSESVDADEILLMGIGLDWVVCTPRALCRSRSSRYLMRFSDTRNFAELICQPSEETAAIKVLNNLIFYCSLHSGCRRAFPKFIII